MKDRNDAVSERRKNEVRKVLPLLWQSYQHIYNVRETNTQNRINILLITATFLPVLSASLYVHFLNKALLLPVFLQILALLFLLKDFFIRGRSIPWFETKKLLRDLENGDFEAASFATLKAAEEDTHANLVDRKRTINMTLELLFVSIFVLIEAMLASLFSMDTFSVLTVVNAFVFVMLYRTYYRRSLPFNFDRNYEESKKEIDKWLNHGLPRPVEKKPR